MHTTSESPAKLRSAIVSELNELRGYDGYVVELLGEGKRRRRIVHIYRPDAIHSISVRLEWDGTTRHYRGYILDAERQKATRAIVTVGSPSEARRVAEAIRTFIDLRARQRERSYAEDTEDYEDDE